MGDDGRVSAPTGALAVLGRRRRVIEDGAAHEPRTSETAPWVTGVLAAVQAAIASLALLVLPAVIVFVLSSGEPTNQGVEWTTSASTGAGLWLLAHGVPLVVGGTDVSLVPLGLSLLAGLLCYGSARRTAHPGLAAWGAGVGTYTAIVLFVMLVSGHAGLPQAGMAVLGGALVSGVALGAASVVHPDGLRAEGVLRPLTDRLPAALRVGVRGGLVVTGLLVVAASFLALLWMFLGRSRSMDVVTALGVTGFDAVVLAAAQATYVGNLVAWGTTWIAGPGFVVGTGSHFGPTAAEAGPMPVVPLLGALPSTSDVHPAWSLVPLLVVLFGMVAGVLVRRRLPGMSWPQAAVAAVTTALCAGLVVGALASVAGGAVGPGRMQEVGADRLAVAGAVTAETFLGVALWLGLWHESTRAWLGSLVTRDRWRRVPEPDDGATADDAAAGDVAPDDTTSRAADGDRGMQRRRSRAGSTTSARSVRSSRTAGSVRTASTGRTAPTGRTAATGASSATSRTATTGRTSATSRTAASGRSATTGVTAATGNTATTASTAASSAD